MTTLNFKNDAFHRGMSFRVIITGRRGDRTITCYLFDADDKIFVMQESACLKSHYSIEDRAELARLNAMTPIRDGDVVEVEGQQYKVKINGDYSDAGYLIKL
jgi:hypothetical protein